MEKNDPKNNQPDGRQPIPEGGTLGLLAAGWRGIMLWREERHRYQLARQMAGQTQKGKDEKK